MQENQIGKEVSSGAEKVESLEKQKKPSAKKRTAEKNQPVKKQRAKAQSKPRTAQKKVSEAQKREEAAAEKRVQLAKKKAGVKEEKLMRRAQIKQKRLEKRLAIKEKKLARKAKIAEQCAERQKKAQEKKIALKEQKAERRAQKAARRELLKNESKADKKRRLAREKKQKLAIKRQKQEQAEQKRAQAIKSREEAQKRRAEERRHKREERAERRRRTPGFGGWLAAVISLGAACLALATVVTAGSFRMNGMMLTAANSARANLYELVSMTEKLDDSLSKLRVSGGVSEQRRLLTDVLVDTALIEGALERMPVDQATAGEISSFVNRANGYAKQLLGKLNAGKALSQEEREAIEKMYAVNLRIYRELSQMASNMTEKDLLDFLNGVTGNVSDAFQQMGTGAHEGMQESEAPMGNVGENQLSGLEEVTSARAEQLVKEYFAAYHVQDVCYTGETLSRKMNCYNFVLTDEDGVEIFAQITKNGGKLALFERYEQCEQKNFDLNTCDGLAKQFLSGLGIENVQAVWMSETGTTADITYVYSGGNVRVYPDMVRVRVCESKGKVVGMDASAYLLNHTERAYTVGISPEEAEAKLAGTVEVSHRSLALIPMNGEELLTYEFDCTYGEEEYLIYLDATTGDEVQVLRMHAGEQGRFLS